MTNKEAKIFVNIASYRDLFLPHTINQIIKSAKYPERVTFGILWQYGDEEIKELPFDKNQVRVLKVPAIQSKGACWARSLAFELLEKEDFFWLLDSHLMVKENWDEILLKQYFDTKDFKAILSCAASQWDPPYGFGNYHGKKNTRAVSTAERFSGPILLQMNEVREECEKPELNSFLTACNLFGPSKWIHDVPYDPDLLFLGEEISLAARSFTHGYNHYATTVNMVSHKHDRHYRVVFSDDHPKAFHDLDAISIERLESLLTNNKNVDLGRYGSGSVRTINQYEKYCGVDFTNQIITDRAKTGRPDLNYLNPMIKMA